MLLKMKKVSSLKTAGIHRIYANDFVSVKHFGGNHSLSGQTKGVAKYSNFKETRAKKDWLLYRRPSRD
jgi:hypothetical protein